MQVLSQMDHPNIIAYHDSFERDGILMIEMEYADGGNLQELLIKQTALMEERFVVDIFYQVDLLEKWSTVTLLFNHYHQMVKEY